MARNPQIGWVVVLGAVASCIFAASLTGTPNLSGMLGHVGQGFLTRLFPTAQPTVVDSKHEITYVGSLESGVEHFQNIFYAEDTSGENRFRPPVPVRPSKGSIVDATQTGAWCPQGTGDILPFTSVVINISENCLSLRIARSQGTASDAKLPVMVWMHGGGHALGSGSDILYTPDGLVKQAAADGQPVIWVAINYRLGMFGFAANKAIVDTKEANVGLRDQRAAFEWVRDNIEHFGGDPQRVTSIGQSVGALDTAWQMAAFGGTQGAPFQRAIMMSGGLNTNFNTLPSRVANNTAAVAREVGCGDKDSDSVEMVDCLRRIPFELLTNVSVTASRNARPPFGEGFFHAIYDGDFIQDRPSELLRAGKITKGIPVIASWTVNDGAWYPAPTISTDEQVLASFGLWLSGLSAETNKKLLELYPLADFAHMVRPDVDGPISPQYYRAAQLNRDLWFTCPVLDFAWQYLRTGGAAPSDIRLYAHNATRYTPVLQAMGVPMWRVSHLSDIAYVLNNQALVGGADNSPEQLRLASDMSRRIVRFVHGKKDRDSSWPAAFDKVTPEELQQEGRYPSSFAVQVFGGHAGTGTATARREGRGAAVDESALDEAMRWEKLFERCEFINSESVRKEVGV
jgi:carboxylesterase type B